MRSKKLCASPILDANASLNTIGDENVSSDGVAAENGVAMADMEASDMDWDGVRGGTVRPITDRSAAIVTDSRGRWHRPSHMGKSALKSCGGSDQHKQPVCVTSLACQ